MIQRICRFQTQSGGEHWGLLGKNSVEEIVPDPFGPYAPTGLAWPLKAVQLLAPCRPSKIVCVGVNYGDHASEFGKSLPDEPLIFLKPPSAIIAPGEPIRLPSVSKRVDHEGELAIVIGREAYKVSRAAARSHILGYTIMNDVSARDIQKKDGQWARAKGFDTFGPLGPWIAVGIDPDDLKIEVFLNGKRKQNARTSQMVYKADALVSFISQAMTLFPGDVISTGTPSGVSPMKKGDKVEVRIEKIGSLINPVR